MELLKEIVKVIRECRNRMWFIHSYNITYILSANLLFTTKCNSNDDIIGYLPTIVPLQTFVKSISF